MSDKLEIVWVFEKYVNGGAFTSALHLHDAFKKYAPEISHKIFICPLNSAFKSKKKWEFEHEVVTTKKLKAYLRSNETKKICFIHKLMNTRVDRYLRPLMRTCPIYIINHTYTKRASASKYGPCSGVVSVSELMRKEQRQKNGVLNHFCIHNSIFSDHFENIPAEINEEKKNYFVTGRINALNSIKYSDKWIKLMYSNGFEGKIWHDYIGSGGGKKTAKKIIANNSGHKNKVVMLGQVNDVEKKISILKSWDIFFYHINSNEGTSMAILEALACGIPVVCSNHHGNNELIEEGVNGFVFKDFKHAIKIVNDLIKNPDKLSDLKKTTKEHFVDHLSSQRWVDKYINIIKSDYKLSKHNRVIKVLSDDGEKENKPYTSFPLSRSGKKNTSKKKGKEKKGKEKRSSKTMGKGIKRGRKFTILSTFFNYSNFTSDWFDSVLKQSYRPLEVVVVDDCSRDDTYAALKSFSKIAKKNDIEYIVHRNSKRMFCGSAYREAFRLSSGEYFGILDGDDQLVDDAVNIIMEQYSKRPNIDYIYSQFVYCDHNMNVTKRKGLCSSPLPGKDMLNSELSRDVRHCYSHWRTFRRFNKVEKIFYLNGRKSVDKFMGYRLEEWGNGMFYDRVLYKYRKPHKKSITKAGGQISEWKRVRSSAYKRRKKYKLKSKKIITIK